MTQGDLGHRTELISPEYWGGIDINNPAQFSSCHPQDTAVLRIGRERKASFSLERTLKRVLEDNYCELHAYTPDIFNPDISELEDGTVVIVDEENLTKYVYPEGAANTWEPEDFASSAPRLDAPFASYWRNHHSSPQRQGAQVMGEEVTRFTDQHLEYARQVGWGVLMSDQKQGCRLLARWAFGEPIVHSDGSIFVPFGGPASPRLADKLPVVTRTVLASPTPIHDDHATRTIRRVRGVSVVQPAEQHKKRKGGLKQRLKALDMQIAQAVLPAPVLEPVWVNRLANLASNWI